MADGGGGVCVLGGGVIGMAVALRLLQQGRTSVTVIADQFSPHTTGDGAAGFWEPYYIGETPATDILRWGRETFDWIESLSQSETAAECGAFQVQSSYILRENVQDPIWSKIVHGFRRMTMEDLKQYPGHKCGFAFTTLMSEGCQYVNWLTKRCQALGAKFIQKKITDLNEVASFDFVVNCTGFGARDLLGDDAVYPVKGQIIMVEAPWIKDCRIFADEGLCLLVGSDRIYVGGTKEIGNEDPTPDPVQSDRLWREMTTLVPSLTGAKRLGEWGGLRPGRHCVRLEAEEVVLRSGAKLKVVHNYGHGGAGLTLHWGCAAECTRLITRMQSQAKL